VVAAPANNKVRAALDYAKTYDDLDKPWVAGRNPDLTLPTINNMIFANATPLVVAGNPTASLDYIKRAQKLARRTQEANLLTSYDSAIHVDLNAEYLGTQPPYTAVNAPNNAVGMAISRLDNLQRNQQPPSSTPPSTPPSTPNNQYDPLFLAEFKQRANDALNSKIEEHKKSINLASATKDDLDKIKKMIKDIED
jgi:hypothetical protein